MLTIYAILVSLFLSLFPFSFFPFLTPSLFAAATCPVCSHDKAAYIEVPITADETSIFYKCLNGNCRHDWCKDVYL